MHKPNDEQLDRLIGEHFAAQDSRPPDFEQLWQQAEQDVASRATAQHRRRWMRLASAAVLVVGVGGVLVATNLLRTDSPTDGQIAQFAVDQVGQVDEVDEVRLRCGRRSTDRPRPPCSRRQGGTHCDRRSQWHAHRCFAG